MAAKDRASDRSRKKKSNFTGFLGTKLWKNQLISREFLGANFTKKQLVKNGQFSGYFQGKFHLKLIGFCTDQTSLFNVFETEVIICSFNNNTLQK